MTLAELLEKLNELPEAAKTAFVFIVTAEDDDFVPIYVAYEGGEVIVTVEPNE